MEARLQVGIGGLGRWWAGGWMDGGRSLEVLPLVVGQGQGGCEPPLLVEPGELLLGHLYLLRFEGECVDEGEVGVASEGAEDPEEGLLVLVVALGGDVEVLEAALAVEGDLARLDLAVLDVHLVPHHHDRHMLHHPRQVLVPLRHALVGDPRCHVEHQDGRLGADVVPLPQPTQLLLPGRVPEVEADGPVGGVEGNAAHLHTLGRDVPLLELPRDVPPQEGRLPHAAVPHHHHLELRSQRLPPLAATHTTAAQLHQPIISNCQACKQQVSPTRQTQNIKEGGKGQEGCWMRDGAVGTWITVGRWRWP